MNIWYMNWFVCWCSDHILYAFERFIIIFQKKIYIICAGGVNENRLNFIQNGEKWFWNEWNQKKRKVSILIQPKSKLSRRINSILGNRFELNQCSILLSHGLAEFLSQHPFHRTQQKWIHESKSWFLVRSMFFLRKANAESLISLGRYCVEVGTYRHPHNITMAFFSFKQTELSSILGKCK